MLVGHHAERFVVDIDTSKILESIIAEISEMTAGATANFENRGVLGRIVVKYRGESLTDLVRADLSVVGGRNSPERSAQPR